MGHVNLTELHLASSHIRVNTMLTRNHQILYLQLHCCTISNHNNVLYTWHGQKYVTYVFFKQYSYCDYGSIL